jgi:hypothetical protein
VVPVDTPVVSSLLLTIGCPLSKAALTEPPLLPPEAPSVLLFPLLLGEAAPLTAASEPLHPPLSPGGLPASCPAAPSPATPPDPVPASGFRRCALLGELWVLETQCLG